MSSVKDREPRARAIFEGNLKKFPPTNDQKDSPKNPLYRAVLRHMHHIMAAEEDTSFITCRVEYWQPSCDTTYHVAASAKLWEEDPAFTPKSAYIVSHSTDRSSFARHSPSYGYTDEGVKVNIPFGEDDDISAWYRRKEFPDLITQIKFAIQTGLSPTLSFTLKPDGQISVKDNRKGPQEEPVLIKQNDLYTTEGGEYSYKVRVEDQQLIVERLRLSEGRLCVISGPLAVDPRELYEAMKGTSWTEIIRRWPFSVTTKDPANN